MGGRFGSEYAGEKSLPKVALKRDAAMSCRKEPPRPLALRKKDGSILFRKADFTKQ
jgi:hypothetical protein